MVEMEEERLRMREHVMNEVNHPEPLAYLSVFMNMQMSKSTLVQHALYRTIV